MAKKNIINAANLAKPGEQGFRLYRPKGKKFPDGKDSQYFTTAQEAQDFIDKYYPDYNLYRYIREQSQDNSEYPNQLNEVTVTPSGAYSTREPHFASEDIPVQVPNRNTGINRFIGSAYSPEFQEKYDRIGNHPIFNDVRVENVARESKKNSPIYTAFRDASDITGALATAPIMAEAYAASPLIAGAMNLYGAYEGLGRLTSDEGVAKTVDKFGQGDWKGGLKSLGGDVFDVALSLPVLNRMRQSAATLGNSAQVGSRALAGNQAAKQLSRMSPHYNFQFNWKTGKFNLTPKSGMPSKTTSAASGSLPPTNLPDGSINPEYYQQLANTRQAPAKVNNVIEPFDWGVAGETTPVATTQQVAQYDDLLRNNNYIRSQNGNWVHTTDNGVFTFGDNGEITFLPYNEPGIQLQPDEVERFIQLRNARLPNLKGPFRNLDDFVIKNQYSLRNAHSFYRGWRFNHAHPSGNDLPVALRTDNNNSIAVQVPNLKNFIIPTTPETTNQEVYDGIMNYLNNISIPKLTDEQRALIQRVFPHDISNNTRLRRQYSIDLPATAKAFVNDRGGSFIYYPIGDSGATFSMNGVGYKNFNKEPIANLTAEALEPVKAPTIITSRDRMPAFSKENADYDWAKFLGIDPVHNNAIKVGLLRGRPTETQVKQALSMAPHENYMEQGDASVRVEDVRPRFTSNYPYIETSNNVPTVHINLLPSKGKLNPDDSRWVADKLDRLAANAKGVDITSTGRINPTLSRVVSDVTNATNLSDAERVNIIKMSIEHPEYFFNPRIDGGNYSPHSMLSNIKRGRNKNKYFTEGALNTWLDGLNDYGGDLDNPIKELLGVNPSQLGRNSPAIDLDPTKSTKILEYLKYKYPYFYNGLQNKTEVPFPVSTVLKKGGKLIKKKFKLNVKNKTCK